MHNNAVDTNEKYGVNMDNKNLLTPSTEELKKEELISVLAGLIKNYANKKQQK